MKYLTASLTALAAATALPSLAAAQSVGIATDGGVGVSVGGQDVRAGARANAGVGIGQAVDRVAGAAQGAVGFVRDRVQDMPPPPGAEVSAEAHAQAHGNSADARARGRIDVDAIESGTVIVNTAGKTLGTVVGIARDAAETPIGLTVQMNNENTITLPLAAVENRNGALVMVDGE